MICSRLLLGLNLLQGCRDSTSSYQRRYVCGCCSSPGFTARTIRPNSICQYSVHIGCVCSGPYLGRILAHELSWWLQVVIVLGHHIMPRVIRESFFGSCQPTCALLVCCLLVFFYIHRIIVVLLAWLPLSLCICCESCCP